MNIDTDKSSQTLPLAGSQKCTRSKSTTNEHGPYAFENPLRRAMGKSSPAEPVHTPITVSVPLAVMDLSSTSRHLSRLSIGKSSRAEPIHAPITVSGFVQGQGCTSRLATEVMTSLPPHEKSEPRECDPCTTILVPPGKQNKRRELIPTTADRDDDEAAIADTETESPKTAMLVTYS